jgi:hypothetical protein
MESAATGSIQILSFLLFPFIIAGSYGIIREKKGDLATFLRYATGHYFRVLLPLIIIVFAAFVTIFLLIIPMALMGGGPTPDMIFFIAMGVTIPFMLFTYFYDCFAVFKDEKIFDSLRSSITIVLYNSWKILLFIIVNIVVLGTLLFGLAFVWMGLLWEKMSEIGAMDPEVISAMSGEEVMALLGPDALFATQSSSSSGRSSQRPSPSPSRQPSSSGLERCLKSSSRSVSMMRRGAGISTELSRYCC